MGVLAALFTAVMSSAKDLVSKMLAHRVDPDVSTFASFAFALPFYAVIAVGFSVYGYEEIQISSTFLTLVFLRGLSDVCAEGCKMRALKHGDVSLVTGLLALSPLVLTILSPWITGDTVTVSDVIAISLIVAGGLFLVRRKPQTGAIVQPKAVLYALAGSVAFALNTCLDRLAVVHAGPVTSAFAMTVCAAVLTSPVVLRSSVAHRELAGNARGFLLRGVFETLFMIAKMVALMSLPAHIVLGLVRVSMLITVVAGGMWFHEEDRVRRIVGTVVMYAGLLLLVL
jgi:uncharacterized membrane protein